MRRLARSVAFVLSALLFLHARPLHAQGTEDPPEEAVESDGEPTEGDEGRFEIPRTIEAPGLEWTEGPAKFPVGSIALIDVPQGYRATDAKGTRIVMERFGNRPNPSHLATLMPSDTTAWFVLLSFADVGHVPDDEKDDLDADAILETIRQSNDEANTYRSSHGQLPLRIVGWEVKPTYNAATHNVEWAVRAEAAGMPIVNYDVRILGRLGFTSAKLIVEPADLAATLPTFRSLLTGFSYNTGSTYGEYRKGDRLAEYGLKGLIAGGAVAVALKTGLLQKLWKFILIGLVAIGGFIKKLFGGKGGGERPRQRPGGGTPGSAQ